MPCFTLLLAQKLRFLHSELDLERVADATADWNVGDTMDVMCVGSFDGKAKLSRWVERSRVFCQVSDHGTIWNDASCSADVPAWVSLSPVTPANNSWPLICRKEVLLRDAGQPGNWQWPDGSSEPVVGEDGR